MRIVLGIIAALSLVSSTAAQVIGGESTYEDNFAHTPPPAENPAQHDAGPSTDPDPAKTPSRDLRERDRD